MFDSPSANLAKKMLCSPREKGNDCRDFAREKYSLMLLCNNEGLLKYENQSISLRPSTFLWLDADSHYQIKWTKPCQPQPWLLFSTVDCDTLFSLFQLLTLHHCYVSCPSVSALSDMLLSVLRSNPALDLGEMLWIDSRIRFMISELLKLAHLGSQNIEIKTHAIDEVRQYLDLHYRDKISLDQLSEHFNINKFHLQKLFKKQYKMSPNAYLIRQRIQHAKERMDSGTSVREASEFVGIENCGHFIKLFKQSEGITPGEYKKRNAE